MTGKEKIRAAFSEKGTAQFPVVICYEGIFIRDHWENLTELPWYVVHLPDIESQIKWNEDVITKINQDWFVVYPFYSRSQRKNIEVKIFDDRIIIRDKKQNTEKQFSKPVTSGWSVSKVVQSVKREKLPETIDELEKLLPERPGKFNRDDFVGQGHGDLACALIEKFPDKMPFSHVSSPLWRMYGILGFEGLMTTIVTHPELIDYGCERFLEIATVSVQQYIACGAQLIWIEECMTDMIGPAAFERFNLPYLKKLVSAIRDAGGKSIYYYCGNPWDRMDKILQVGADALSFEESKKNFQIDIEKVVSIVDGRCVVFGNLDAIYLLPHADEKQLVQEIERQLTAGVKNKRKFVMSLGSPVTPDTPVERVRLYCEVSREIGGKI